MTNSQKITEVLLINNNLFFLKGIFHEDELWVPSVFIHAKSIELFNDGFYCYRLNRYGSIINKPNIKKLFDRIIVGEKLGEMAGISLSGDNVIRMRRAALLFGLILELNSYKGNPRYDELKNSIIGHVEWLCYGKYRLLKVLCHIVGVERLSNLIAIVKR